jgi:hypothetical protein
LTPTATPAPTPTDPRSTPEGATRAFFDGVLKGTEDDDPSLVEPYVTSKDSSAYLSVPDSSAVRQGVNRGSVVTTQTGSTT